MSETDTSTNKHLCIHGHFYQPPRENPWLNAIELQRSALPYHDWNERVTRECYGPNARARLLENGGRIQSLVNNYEYMSFNFGPTLLSWLEKTQPWIYAQILAADLVSRGRYQGHGNALAQVFNHIIMPLATRSDKLTQIRWGLADFMHRFGRRAEGMWLAETAVDTETLGLMSMEGVKFTILSPDQADMVRPVNRGTGSGRWEDVSGGRIDISKPYLARVDGSGQRFMSIFFYHGALSRAVAYERLLASGAGFLARIRDAFNPDAQGPELVSLATDGESYGHHFKFGDMALTWLFDNLKENDGISLTNYGSYLERFPPQYEVKIIENSSWSCAHGVERWRSDCGCNVTHTPGWNQAWRAPLREGLDWLADRLSSIFVDRGERLFKYPWEARDDYIAVILDPSVRNRDLFLDRNARRHLDGEGRAEALQLLESQRMSLYMFTSCGWFFDDISGLEATQVLKYSSRAIDLVREWAGIDLTAGLLRFLAEANSNAPAYRDGAEVYREMVLPSRISPSLAVANSGVTVLGRGAPRMGHEDRPFSETVALTREISLEREGVRAIGGEATVTEPGTALESKRIYLAFVKDGEDPGCLVGEAVSKVDFDGEIQEILKTLTPTGVEEIEAILRRYARRIRRYKVKDLMPDTQSLLDMGALRSLDRCLIDSIRKRRKEAERFISLFQETSLPCSESLDHIVGLLIADELTRMAESDPEEGGFDRSRLALLVNQAKQKGIVFSERFLKERIESILRLKIKSLAATPARASAGDMIGLLELVREMGLKPDLWECRNSYWGLSTDQGFINALGLDLAEDMKKLGHLLGFA